MPDKPAQVRRARAFADMTDGDVIIAFVINGGPDDNTITKKVRVQTTFNSANTDGTDPQQEKTVIRRVRDASDQAALDANDPGDPHKALTTFADGDAAKLRPLLAKILADAHAERKFA